MVPLFKWIRQVVDHAELMDEVIPGQPVVELLGEGRVLIEGHKGVVAYSDCEISVNTRIGVVAIAGCNLKLTNMSASKLIISGNVFCVQLAGRKNK